jgi:hypothetical protein
LKFFFDSSSLIDILEFDVELSALVDSSKFIVNLQQCLMSIEELIVIHHRSSSHGSLPWSSLSSHCWSHTLSLDLLPWCSISHCGYRLAIIFHYSARPHSRLSTWRRLTSWLSTWCRILLRCSTSHHDSRSLSSPIVVLTTTLDIINIAVFDNNVTDVSLDQISPFITTFLCYFRLTFF